jgi:HEAT repeats
MQSRILRPFTLALMLALAAPAWSAAAPSSLPLAIQEGGEEPAKQEDVVVVDDRPEVAQQLAQLEAQVAEKGKQDKEAQGTLDAITAEFAKSGPKDRALIVKSVAKILTVARKDLAKDIPDEELKTYTAVMLGRMGPESAEVLIAHLGHKKMRETIKAQRAVILALGQTQVEKGIKPLLKVLDDPQWEFVAAAAEALGNYLTVEQKVRKEIFNELLQRILPLADILETDQGQNNFGNANDYELLNKEFEIIRGPIRASLERLSKHTEPSFLQWRSWWNDNKKKDWDAQA